MRVPALLMAAALVAAGCGGSTSTVAPTVAPTTAATAASTAAPTAAPETKLTVQWAQEPLDWNFLVHTGSGVQGILGTNVIQSLLELKAGKLQPLLAESWEASTDGLTYTFKMRAAKFHNGKPVTASDVKYSLENNMKGVPVISGPLAVIDSVKAKNALTVVVTLKRPSINFLLNLAMISGWIYPEGSADSIASGPIGTGPYVFGEWRPNQDVTLHRFDGYWGAKPYYSTVTFRMITDELTAINALKAGEIDALGQIFGAGLDGVLALKSDANFTVQELDTDAVGYYVMHVDAAKFQDARVRQAVAYSIDRAAIVKGAYKGVARPTCVWVAPPTLPWSSDYCPYAFDPAKGRALLEQAGKVGLEIGITYLDNSEFGPIAEVIASGLEATGFKVVTKGMDLATYLDYFFKGTTAPVFDTTSLAGGVPIFNFAACPDSLGGACNPELEKLLNSADAAASFDEYVTMMKKASVMQTDAAWVIPMYTVNKFVVFKKSITGIPTEANAHEYALSGLASK